MKLSRKCQVLWILILFTIHNSDSAPDDDDEDELSRSHRLHGSSAEITCRYRRQQGVCRRRSECRKPTRNTCRFGIDPVVCCMDKDEPVTTTTTKKPSARTTKKPSAGTTQKPQTSTPKKMYNLEESIDITFPNCGKRSPNVQSRTTAKPTRRGLISRLGKRDVSSYLRLTRFKRWNQVMKPVIVGGREAQSNSWPWMVALFRSAVSGGTKRYQCGGSLISRRYVITAAHCFDGEKGQIDPSRFSIIVGSHTTKDGTEYPVSNVLLHPDYQLRQYYNDLSVIKIGKDVQLTNKVYPVCLPSEGLKDKIRIEENEVTVTGWGDTTFGGVSSQVLHEVNVPIVPLKECNASYSKMVVKPNFPRGITDVFICAGLKEGGKDACQGDSGGPMVNKLKDHSYVQLGVVSFGYGCAQAGYPGVYTRLSKYTKWFYDNTDLGR